MGLRQKIEGLKARHGFGEFRYNKAIDDVLALLDEAMAEKDKPNMDGVWLWFNGYEYELYYVTKEMINSNFYKDYHGKWINITDILPEVGE